jgi:putative PIN family toxin of toxin-antitoxin system
MNNERRFVFDVNVLMSSLLTRNSKPEQALKKSQLSGQIIMSQAIWMELEQVIMRPKFDKYITVEERQRFLLDFFTVIEFTEITESISVCRDFKDDKLLELAVSGRAESIITGDQDLLILNPFRDIQILTVQSFLEKN